MLSVQQFPPSLFRGRHFDQSIIILYVRWCHALRMNMPSEGEKLGDSTMVSGARLIAQ
jgi:hypothetical protein